MRRTLFRAHAGSADAIRNINRDFADVVRVVRLSQLVTEAERVGVGACLAGSRAERRVDGDANHVLAWRHGVLTVAAVEHEVLAAKMEVIRIGPAGADALIARNAD